MTALVILILVAGVLGACFLLAAARCGWLGLQLDPHVGVVQVLGLIVDVVILGLLQYYLVSTVGDRRVEKNLLITGARDSVATLRACRDAIEATAAAGRITAKDKTSILRRLRQLSNDLDALQSALEMSQFSSLKDRTAEIRWQYLRYKSAATGGEFPSKPYTQALTSEQGQAYRLLERKLHSLIFEINRRR